MCSDEHVVETTCWIRKFSWEQIISALQTRGFILGESIHLHVGAIVELRGQLCVLINRPGSPWLPSRPVDCCVILDYSTEQSDLIFWSKMISCYLQSISLESLRVCHFLKTMDSSAIQPFAKQRNFSLYITLENVG